jgi:hypothetical protein
LYGLFLLVSLQLFSLGVTADITASNRRFQEEALYYEEKKLLPRDKGETLGK